MKQILEIEELFEKHKIKSVVKIGSNDGKYDDVLYDTLIKYPTIKCLFVDPIQNKLNECKKNFLNFTNAKYECVAVSVDNAPKTLYVISEKAWINELKTHSWWDKLASFNPKHIENHCGKHFSNRYLAEIKVPSIPLMDLLQKTEFLDVDLLHVDTEGHDWSILKQIDYNVIAPKLILFEKRHLLKKELDEAIVTLSQKYVLQHQKFDILCELKK
jgi:FkbM family methyltransferase